ncbi:MAG: hypothetical protein M0R76_11885 [Proteobacteria bacterium]|nr:hypothetical protein [Pseudomonadota bacterium]
MSEPSSLRVLIVEDGDEYLENLRRFVIGPHYLQAHSGDEAIARLSREPIDILYLDMRFDRIPTADLMGDLDAATREHNGDSLRALRFLQNNQGLFILEGLRRAGFGHVPVILSYDFSREPKRWIHLKGIHPSLAWVPDAVSPGEISALMHQLRPPQPRVAKDACD